MNTSKTKKHKTYSVWARPDKIGHVFDVLFSCKTIEQLVTAEQWINRIMDSEEILFFYKHHKTTINKLYYDLGYKKCPTQ